MIDVSGVRFKKTGKIYYFDPRDIDTKIGDNVIVETSRGIEYGTVVIKKELKEEEILTELKPVLRIASPEDDLRQLDNRNDAREALIICENKCKEHKLNMKLIGCEYTFDRGKLLFYFTADGRIDFRELVRDLASIFRTRIELRQIGVRDEAKKIGGLGPCGRPCCCRAFLSEFSPVSIKMAKDQELSLNPTKISGLCGRLMCCLKYEQDGYECIFKKMPRLGEFVMTDRGEGTVIDKYTIQELVKIQFQNGEDIEVEIRDLDQIKRSGKMNKNFTQLNSSLKDEEVRESELKDLEEWPWFIKVYYFMKIKLLIQKIHSKIKLFFYKKLGNTDGAIEIGAFILAAVLTLASSYYLQDLLNNKYLGFLIAFAFIFSLVRIILYLLEFPIVYIKKIKSKNIILFSATSYASYKLIYDMPGMEEFTDLQNYLIIFLVSLLFFLFSKSLISLIKNKKISFFISFIISAMPMILILYFLFTPGFSKFEGKIENYKKGPESPEKYSVIEKDYQGGQVNLLPYVHYTGRTKKVRDKILGDQLIKTPIKGRIYLPDNNRENAIVFIFHGNHRATEKSHLGYDYLGRYLSKRGIGLVSVDMNILNGLDYFSLSDENDARAILGLENIKYILEESEFKNKIKKEIFLGGHSRGGEAASLACYFNDYGKNPEDATRKLDYNFKIKGLINLAATYGQYKPTNKNLALQNINYLVLHWTNDYDLDTFEELALYREIKNTDENLFKAAIYIGGANHGNFNTRWKDMDTDYIEGLYLEKSNLFKGEDQRKITSILIENFVNKSLNKDYDQNIFYDIEKSQTAYPEGIYYQMYSEGNEKILMDFEEDNNINTGSLKNSKIRYTGFTKIREKNYDLVEDHQETLLSLNFNEKGLLEFLPQENLKMENYFSIDLKKDKNIKISLNIRDNYGETGVISLEDYKKLKEPYKVQMTKIETLRDNYTYTSSLETVRVPMEDIKKKNPKINLDKIKYIDLIFEGNGNVEMYGVKIK